MSADNGCKAGGASRYGGKPLLVLSHSEKDTPLSRFECTKQGDMIELWGYVCERGAGADAAESGDVTNVWLG
jgi:hypothetical protein